MSKQNKFTDLALQSQPGTVLSPQYQGGLHGGLEGIIMGILPVAPELSMSGLEGLYTKEQLLPPSSLATLVLRWRFVGRSLSRRDFFSPHMRRPGAQPQGLRLGPAPGHRPKMQERGAWASLSSLYR